MMIAVGILLSLICAVMMFVAVTGIQAYNHRNDPVYKQKAKSRFL